MSEHNYNVNDIKGKINNLAMRMYDKGRIDERTEIIKELENLIDKVGTVDVFENDNHLTYLGFYYAVKDFVEKGAEE